MVWSIFLCFLIGTFIFFGDFLDLKLSRGWSSALVDNVTHGIVALTSWMVISQNRNHLRIFGFYNDSILCGLLASLVDIDHFICAQSLLLSEATKLKSRPFLHNTLLFLVFGLSVLAVGKISGLSMVWPVAWIVLTAGLTHHIRDATRRGFCFWPFGSSSPVPYPLYIIVQTTFPLLLSKLEVSLHSFLSPDRIPRSSAFFIV